MKWRKEPPDKPGYYWVRNYGERSRVIQVAGGEKEGCRLYSALIPDCFDVAPNREWAGPIEEPQEYE